MPALTGRCKCFVPLGNSHYLYASSAYPETVAKATLELASAFTHVLQRRDSFEG